MSVGTQVVRPFEVRGAVQQLWKCKDEEILIHGPAGTGKSRGALEKLHLALTKYKNARGLLVRQTRSSLTNTGMVTFEKEVLCPGDNVKFHTPSQSYPYPNGSALVVGGMDDPAKIMSAQYDMALFQECTEANITGWENITTRLRNGMMPYQQLIGDANPGPPSHWLWRRCLSGTTTEFASKHEDNPILYDKLKKKWTDRGKKYLAKLDKLTGIRFKRLRQGIWCSAEGAVYDTWDANIHLIDRFEIPASWPRYWGVDFGYTNPFVWAAYAQDPDGRLIRYREIYHTQRTVSQHCATIRSLNEPKPRAVICDHDAEDRATFEAELGVPTIPANKAVSTGIQAVADRLRVAGDGKPRILFMKDSLLEKDADLEEKMLPLSTDEEFDSYVWDDSTSKKKEVPVKEFDHGMDQMRYAVMHVDSRLFSAPSLIALT